jgi:tRNA pseudouridine38-40 synthase
MPPRGWVLQLNQNLPDDVTVRAARAVHVTYNPRFTSVKKRYRYLLVRDKVPDPLLRNRAWRVGFDMDMARMVREARAIVGTHDFAAFRSARDVREVTTRAISSVEVAQIASDPRLWTITIEGNSFLYNMVRILVGTLVDVARDVLPEGAIANALEMKERGVAGQTAPAHGLTLMHIDATLPEGAGDPWPP